MPIQAIIFVPAHCADAARWLDHCFVYCSVRGYLPLHVVRRWCDVIAILAGGLRAVVVAGKPEHVDVEFVSEQEARAEDAAHRRPSQKWEGRQQLPGAAHQ